MRLEFAYPDELDDARERRVPLFIPVGVIEYHGTLDRAYNPWNWLRVAPLFPRDADFDGDHAGEYETSDLWALLPGCVRADKIGSSDDWFAETARNASYEKGKETMELLLDYWVENLR